MRVLHIANDFANSKVHANLCRELDAQGIEQEVYCPVRTQEEIGGNHFEGIHTNIHYSFCIKSWYKFVYHHKARVLYRDLKKHVDLKCIDLIHATTLFSDGALAYKAYKEFGIPYVVAIRNTDLNDFIRLMKHTYPYGRKILENAKQVFFISAGIKKQFETSFFIRPLLDRVKGRFILQPNGIDDYWLQHIRRKPKKEGKAILYIGDFTPNKNVCRLIDAVVELRKSEELKDVTLTIVGGGRDLNQQVEQRINAHHTFINYLGKIYDKAKLAEVMQECAIFAMPSIYETFGLVYIEALSQNLPVLYTKGQGIDGMFDKSVGIGVNPMSVEEIKDALEAMLLHFQDFSNENIAFEEFNWHMIAQTYQNVYQQLIK